jgi:hypothetical protein
MSFRVRSLLLISSILLANVAFAENEDYKYLEGTWGWGNCEDSLHRISFSPNKEFLKFESGGLPNYYFIDGPTSKGLKVVLLEEKRLDDAGNPVFWYIVAKDNNTYYWLRSDRHQDDLRGPIKRCKK